MTETRRMCGRKEILTDVEVITPENVLSVLNTAKTVWTQNQTDINYLYGYYCGDQAVWGRTKTYNTEVLNTVVENRANEIVEFKSGYLVGEPLQYVNNSEDDAKSEEIKLLNEYMTAEDKEAKDRELADWIYICGVGYRGILPDERNDMDDSPFEIYTLDPRSTFIVRHSGIDHKPVMSVQIVQDATTGNEIYTVYTKTHFYKINSVKIVEYRPHYMGDIPVIEYRFNNAMLGAFEIVMGLLDSLNEVASNRVDAIENFVQAMVLFKGVDIDSEDFQKLKEEGAILVPEGGDVKFVVQELNQTQTQELVDYMYQTILTICGMPNRNGGSSTSDTGSAVIMRDGWTLAEARAKTDEAMWKKSERLFLKLAIRFADKYRNLSLRLFDVKIHFTRRNYENVLQKAQILNMLLANDKVHPRLAFESCGLFADPETAYLMSEEYKAEQEKKSVDELDRLSQMETITARASANEDTEDETEEEIDIEDA